MVCVCVCACLFLVACVWYTGFADVRSELELGPVVYGTGGGYVAVSRAMHFCSDEASGVDVLWNRSHVGRATVQCGERWSISPVRVHV